MVASLRVRLLHVYGLSSSGDLWKQEAQAVQPPQRASGTSQAAQAEVQPLKPGFWKSMKIPSRDPPLGGIRVRTDMANDCFGQCLHCLSKAHKCAHLLLRVLLTLCVERRASGDEQAPYQRKELLDKIIGSLFGLSLLGQC